MSPAEAKSIIEALANGINPDTGERLPNKSPFNEPQIIRALFTAAQFLTPATVKQAKRTTSPENAGKPWSEAEDSELLSEFDAGQSVKSIALSHGRTHGAITSRLIRLGRIQERNEAFTKALTNASSGASQKQASLASAQPLNLHGSRQLHDHK